MEILKTISLSLLMIIDILFIIGYVFASNDNDKSGAKICLICLTWFILPTIYIILN